MKISINGLVLKIKKKGNFIVVDVYNNHINITEDVLPPSYCQPVNPYCLIFIIESVSNYNI